MIGNRSLFTLALVFTATGLASCEQWTRVFLSEGTTLGTYTSDAEIHDLFNPDLYCADTAELGYLETSSGVVGTFIGGFATLCGGYKHSNCYYYDHPRDNWVELPFLMSEAREFASAVMLSPNEWWITGGEDISLPEKEQAFQTTEIYTDQVGFSAGPDLPVATYRHDLARVNKTHFFLKAGNPSPHLVWLYNMETDEWVELPDLPQTSPLHNAYAGVSVNVVGHTDLVVAGGTDDPHGRDTDGLSQATFALDLDGDELSWRRVGDLPQALCCGASLQFNAETFMVVSGFNGYQFDPYSHNFYEFVADTEEWTTLDTTITLPRVDLAAFLVPDDVGICVE